MNFNKAKKECDGFVAINPSGEILRGTFVKRKGKTNCGYNKVWAKLTGNTEQTKEQRKKFILRMLAKGWKVQPVVFTLVSTDDD